jgi:lysine 6-dehydrogenase
MDKRRDYLVLGAGKQGVAAAYDLCLHGGAGRLTLADQDLRQARAGVRRLKKLLRRAPIRLDARRVDGAGASQLRAAAAGRDGVLSALPYFLNPAAAAAAVAARAHYCDLGGYFETTLKILKLDARARRAGVSLVPDCGVSPGLCNSLAVCGLERLTSASEVRIYCGGLPQSPRPPLDYKIVFSLEGLLGNYFGKAYALEEGKVVLAEPLSGREELSFPPPLGRLEAAVTGGATSTCPWTFRGRLKTYAYKTLRYPGHFAKIRLLRDLGLTDTKTVKVKGRSVSPRDVFVAAAGPRLKFPDDRDLLVQRVVVRGEKDGRALEIVYDTLDFFDPSTGFTAMQRTTGFSAAAVLALAVQGRVSRPGVVPVEEAVSGRVFLEEIRKRGIAVEETIRAADRAGVA